MTISEGLKGGAMIGASAATLLLFSGEIMGASGIVNSVLQNPLRALRDSSQHWKIVFMASFLQAVKLLLAPGESSELQEVANQRSTLAFLASGLLVGFGAKLGNGCTSGHGICGVGRLSLRSMTAVATFMASAVASTLLTQDSAIWRDSTRDISSTLLEYAKWVAMAVSGLFAAAAFSAPLFFHNKQDEDGPRKVLPGLFTGALFAAGLHVSGMSNPRNVLGFLNVTSIPQGTWDPSLVAVMGSGILVSFLSYQLIDEYCVLPASMRRISLEKPLAMQRESHANFKAQLPPKNGAVDSNLLLGAACFGVGWSLTGMCPAPALFLGAVAIPQVLFQWWPAYFVGMYAASEYKKRSSSTTAGTVKTGK